MAGCRAEEPDEDTVSEAERGEGFLRKAGVSRPKELRSACLEEPSVSPDSSDTLPAWGAGREGMQLDGHCCRLPPATVISFFFFFFK